MNRRLRQSESEDNGKAKGPWEKLTYPAGPGAQIVVCIWAHEVKTDAKLFVSYSVTVERRYNEKGEWKRAKGFRPNDLFTVAYALQKAYEVILEERNC